MSDSKIPSPTTTSRAALPGAFPPLTTLRPSFPLAAPPDAHPFIFFFSKRGYRSRATALAGSGDSSITEACDLADSQGQLRCLCGALFPSIGARTGHATSCKANLQFKEVLGSGLVRRRFARAPVRASSSPQILSLCERSNCNKPCVSGTSRCIQHGIGSSSSARIPTICERKNCSKPCVSGTSRCAQHGITQCEAVVERHGQRCLKSVREETRFCAMHQNFTGRTATDVNSPASSQKMAHEAHSDHSQNSGAGDSPDSCFVTGCFAPAEDGSDRCQTHALQLCKSFSRKSRVLCKKRAMEGEEFCRYHSAAAPAVELCFMTGCLVPVEEGSDRCQTHALQLCSGFSRGRSPCRIRAVEGEEFCRYHGATPKVTATTTPPVADPGVASRACDHDGCSVLTTVVYCDEHRCMDVSACSTQRVAGFLYCEFHEQKVCVAISRRSSQRCRKRRWPGSTCCFLHQTEESVMSDDDGIESGVPSVDGKRSKPDGGFADVDTPLRARRRGPGPLARYRNRR
jgi:hypothetical protein